MYFGSVRAAFGAGECSAALICFFLLTSPILSFLSGDFTGARIAVCIVEMGAELIRLESFMPFREFPFGNSLLRTVLKDCSRAFVRTLRLFEGHESGMIVSGDGLAGLVLPTRGSRVALSRPVECPGGAEGASSFVELGLASE